MCPYVKRRDVSEVCDGEVVRNDVKTSSIDCETDIKSHLAAIGRVALAEKRPVVGEVRWLDPGFEGKRHSRDVQGIGQHDLIVNAVKRKSIPILAGGPGRAVGQCPIKTVSRGIHRCGAGSFTEAESGDQSRCRCSKCPQTCGVP